MHQIYNKHYIIAGAQGRIIPGWSDGPCPAKDTADAVCINGQGGCLFRLASGGVENPPLYKWDGAQALPRAEGEIAADRIPPLGTAQAGKLAELSAACGAALPEDLAANLAAILAAAGGESDA